MEAFTSEETAILEANAERRELMLKNKFADEHIPYSTGEMRVVNEIINSSDSAVLAQAKLRKDIKKNETDSELNASIVAAVSSVMNKRNDVPIDTDRILETPIAISDFEPVPGETSVVRENLELKDYITKDEDA